MIPAARIVELQDGYNLAGHGKLLDEPVTDSLFEKLLLAQHKANFDLWHEEDRARDPGAADAVIAAVKHSIDSLNQRRNDLMEKVDQTLLDEQGQNTEATLHSESPGLIVDRLSILSLKLFHTREESEREDASEDHRQRNRERALVLLEQRTDLAAALDGLWADILEGKRRFKLYRQMKMYNDPDLNPVLYRRAAAGQE